MLVNSGIINYRKFIYSVSDNLYLVGVLVGASVGGGVVGGGLGASVWGGFVVGGFVASPVW